MNTGSEFSGKPPSCSEGGQLLTLQGKMSSHLPLLYLL